MQAELSIATEDDMEVLEVHEVRNMKDAIILLSKHPQANMLMTYDDEGATGTWSKHDGMVRRLN